MTGKDTGGQTLIKILTENFYASSPVSIRLKLIRRDSVTKNNSLENIKTHCQPWHTFRGIK